MTTLKKNEAIVKIICIVEIVGPNEVYPYKLLGALSFLPLL